MVVGWVLGRRSLKATTHDRCPPGPGLILRIKLPYAAPSVFVGILNAGIMRCRSIGTLNVLEHEKPLVIQGCQDTFPSQLALLG
jgi:hypothetical protein